MIPIEKEKEIKKTKSWGGWTNGWIKVS